MTVAVVMMKTWGVGVGDIVTVITVALISIFSVIVCRDRVTCCNDGVVR